MMEGLWWIGMMEVSQIFTELPLSPLRLLCLHAQAQIQEARPR